MTSAIGAMLYQLSYEATRWERGQFIARRTVQRFAAIDRKVAALLK